MAESNKIKEIIDTYTITDIKNSHIDEHIQEKWTSIYESRTGENKKMLNMDSYFDVEGVMTPYVRVWFRGLGNGDNDWIEVGGEEGEKYSQNNFFESMTVEDTGYLALTLNLIDRTNYRVQRLLELATYSQSKRATKAKDNSKVAENFLQAQAKSEDNKDLSLSLFKEDYISTNNLKIRFGYADTDIVGSSEKLKPEAFFAATGERNKNTKANARWVSNKSPDAFTNIGNEENKKYVAIGEANFNNFIQTQPKSYEEEFYIIGFSTSISAAGIRYSIKAIQPTSYFLNSYKLVQNFSKIVGTPREVMAYFMKTFNEKEVGLKVYWYGGKEKQKIENFTRKKVANGIIVEEEIKDNQSQEEAKKENVEEINKNKEKLNFIQKLLNHYSFLQSFFSLMDVTDETNNLISNYEDYYLKLRNKTNFNIGDFENESGDYSNENEILCKMLNAKDFSKMLSAKTKKVLVPSILTSTLEQVRDSYGLTSKSGYFLYDNLIKQANTLATAGASTLNGVVGGLYEIATPFANSCFAEISKDSNKELECYTTNDGITLVRDENNQEWREENYNFITLWLFEFCGKCYEDITKETKNRSLDPSEKNYMAKLLQYAAEVIGIINTRDDNTYKSLYDLKTTIENDMENLAEIKSQLRDAINTQEQLTDQETKQIEIILGSERVLSENPQKQLFKSVSSIFSSYTNQAPCHYEIKDETQEVTVKDTDGNDRVLTKEEVGIPRKMSWACLTNSYFNSEKDKVAEATQAAVIFYYNTPLKFKRIRQYCWGTGNSKQHCVKDLSVASSTEFANVLSKNTYAVDDNTVVKKEYDDKITAEVVNTNHLFRTVVQNEDEVIERAKENLYKGTMTVLGDPSLRFYGRVQPYTFPINIDVRLQTEQNYTQAWQSKNGKNIETTQAKIKTKTVITEEGETTKEEDLSLNQESVLSGYYLVSKITHQIDKSGFYTTLEIMKYPGLEKEV